MKVINRSNLPVRMPLDRTFLVILLMDKFPEWSSFMLFILGLNWVIFLLVLAFEVKYVTPC